MEQLKDFLERTLSKESFSNLVDNVEDDIELFVDDNFEYFGEAVLRKLIAEAIKVRDENIAKGTNSDEVMGPWSLVIDAVRQVTSIRQQRAGKIFQEIVSTAQQAGPKKTQQVLTALYRQKQLDNIFMDLLTDGINKAKQESNPDVIEMFEFFLKVIEKNKAVEKALAMRSGKHESSLATTQPPLPPHHHRCQC